MRKKIIGICGSPNSKNSTTMFALEKAIDVCRQSGLETEIIMLGDMQFGGCTDCSGCRKKLTCTLDDDFKNRILPILADPSVGGIIFASPVYFGGVTAQMKALIDRSVMFRRNGFMFSNVVAGVITVGRSRNGGQELAAMELIKSALIQGMIIVPDAPPTSHFGGNLWSGHPDSVEHDEAGISTAVNLGKNVAQLVNKLNHQA
jgi:multimeric flavodoxin WrbA